MRVGALPRSAFTLTEVLVVLSILGLMAGAAAAINWGRASPEREAGRLMRWVLRSLTKANRTGRSFTLRLSAGTSAETLALRWRDDPVVEMFPAAPGFRFQLVRHSAFAPESIYSPQWGTFTPAATVRITAPRGAKPHYLILSGYGRVRTASSPPPGGVE